ncbi:MAG: glycosyltransferase family 4 protein [Candidatus Marinimicrobia bacterium]|nr:glycosyltransferase family 4 protein [Candidatus Neomarinimicrobiota bacterium]
MKVAVLSTVCWSTPPAHYGPWEQVASNITEGLVEKGIDVTLYATGDSCTGGKLEWVIKHPYGENPEMDAKVCESLHISHLMEQADKYDIIHNNYDFIPLTYSKLIKTPMITTIHGFSSPKIIPIFKKYNDIGYYVSISNSDRCSELNYIATIYNGIQPDQFSFKKEHGNYLLYFGRIHHDKGTFESIQISKIAKMRLIISGIIQDKKYFKEKVEPFVNNDDIIYVGNSGPKRRNELLGGAYALLHPINFNEPFGLSVAESMFCGTPVIAFRRGSMPELIVDGKTGFLVYSVEEAVECLKEIKNLDRNYCRVWADSNFSQKKMVDDYLNVYNKILGIE